MAHLDTHPTTTTDTKSSSSQSIQVESTEIKRDLLLYLSIQISLIPHRQTSMTIILRLPAHCTTRNEPVPELV